MVETLYDRYDFFLSRRGTVAAVACEVATVLTEKGYRVLVQDYDIPTGASFTETMHDALQNSRDLIILFTGDSERSPYTRKEFMSFEAERQHGQESCWRTMSTKTYSTSPTPRNGDDEYWPLLSESRGRHRRLRGRL